MNERRNSHRHSVRLKVDLYHDDFGLVKGHIHDVSTGGMYVDILDKNVLKRKLSNEFLVAKPSNMDVLFNMQCLRVDKNFISLKFLE